MVGQALGIRVAVDTRNTHAVFHLFCSLVTPDKCRLNYILANEAFKTQGGVGCEEFEVGGQNS